MRIIIFILLHLIILMERLRCFFIIKFFYEISQNKKSVHDAYIKAKESDNETSLFSHSEYE
jgi:hypothetical protein